MYQIFTALAFSNCYLFTAVLFCPIFVSLKEPAVVFAFTLVHISTCLHKELFFNDELLYHCSIPVGKEFFLSLHVNIF